MQVTRLNTVERCYEVGLDYNITKITYIMDFVARYEHNSVKFNCQVIIKMPQVPCHPQQLDQLRDLLCVRISVPPRTFHLGEEQTSEDLLAKGGRLCNKGWKEIINDDKQQIDYLEAASSLSEKCLYR